MIKTYPSFDNVRDIKDRIEAQFNRNKVSKEFPLFYLPVSLRWDHLSFLLFDLAERLVCPPETKIIKDWLEKYYKGDSAFDDLKKEIENKTELVFGETQVRKNIEDLLRGLPEPKTIITDIYPSDHCPELLEREFEAFEFKLT